MASPAPAPFLIGSRGPQVASRAPCMVGAPPPNPEGANQTPPRPSSPRWRPRTPRPPWPTPAPPWPAPGQPWAGGAGAGGGREDGVGQSAVAQGVGHGRLVSGVTSLGLRMTALPAARAGIASPKEFVSG